MKSYIYLSDIHANYEALKHLDELPEMQDDTCQFRFGGDYIDGYDLQKNATINTIRYIKNLCDKGKAKAILGNHDQFILDATFSPYKENWWYLNGREQTLENLGIPYANGSDLRELLLYYYQDELNWLSSLPYYIEDKNNILVHAGFDLDIGINEQDTNCLLWTRNPYICFFNEDNELHSDFHYKTIISGHTPTIGIVKNEEKKEKCDIIKDQNPLLTRYFIDGGSKSGLNNGRINLLKLDENGNEIFRAYLDANGVHHLTESNK